MKDDQRPVTVLIVDDNAVVRSGLRSLLESEPGVHVVGEAWDGDRAVDLTRALLPDVVLLDVRMPHRDGVSAARDIANLSRVLMTTFTDDADVVRSAVAAGAVGYLVHGSFQADELAGTVRSVAHGASVFSSQAMRALLEPRQPEATAVRPQCADGLSERQVEIMDLIAAGLTNGEIATRCFLADKTVKNHINRIFPALGVRSRGEAIALWLGAREQPTGRAR